MKKTLVMLLAATVISIGAAQAATENEGPVSKWMNDTSSKVTKQEQKFDQTVDQKTQAKKDKVDQKKSDVKQKKDDVKQKKNESEQKANTKKKQLKELIND